ncbi:hypothetical protein M8J76_010824 [Diaphorina citri]|nr:hypothetical protein M8J76_010824 [Diaphorina citri]KAI5751990.1 hypothetical protein M8J77_012758 [Diaphorina citri]
MATSGPPPLELDPKEVLAHLNYLGYHHITGHQLKDFMKDLKKLIRYDQMKSKENATPTSPHKRKSSQHPSTAHHEKPCKLTHDKRSSSLSSSNLTKTSTNSSSLNSCSTTTTDSQQKPLRPIQSKASLKPSSATSVSAPTFIRPWHMRSNSQIHKAGTSSDPVALYQHYKELWKLQPFPGENNRSELRWKIREKMLGCDPPPRLPLTSRRS